MDLRQTPPTRREVQMVATTIPQRAQELMHLGVDVIVCGALSDILYSLLKGKGLHLICGIAGDLDAVVAAYQDGTLGRACFRMPGTGQNPALREQNEP
jgi:predicted Fe-Mo cluster-binding NifX family protein